MRALVTGASGFAGRHLIDHLVAEGDEVVATDRTPHPGSAALDIADAAAVHRVFDEARPEVIYHLAGWSDVGGSWHDPVAVFRANAEGTLHVLGAARSAGVRRVLVASSADIYGIVGTEQLPITEEHPLRPVSPYAVSKVAADYLGLQAWLGHGQEVLRARAFNHIGPGQGPQFVTAAIAAAIATNERDGLDEVLVGNLAARRDFTDVRDVVRAYRLLVERGEPGEAYNICSGNAVAVQELADRTLALSTVPMRLVIDPTRYRQVDVPTVVGDSTKLQEATGWAPRLDLDTSLADVLAHWRDAVGQG